MRAETPRKVLRPFFADARLSPLGTGPIIFGTSRPVPRSNTSAQPRQESASTITRGTLAQVNTRRCPGKRHNSASPPPDLTVRAALPVQSPAKAPRTRSAAATISPPGPTCIGATEGRFGEEPQWHPDGFPRRMRAVRHSGRCRHGSSTRSVPGCRRTRAPAQRRSVR